MNAMETVMALPQQQQLYHHPPPALTSSPPPPPTHQPSPLASTTSSPSTAAAAAPHFTRSRSHQLLDAAAVAAASVRTTVTAPPDAATSSSTGDSCEDGDASRRLQQQQQYFRSSLISESGYETSDQQPHSPNTNNNNVNPLLFTKEGGAVQKDAPLAHESTHEGLLMIRHNATSPQLLSASAIEQDSGSTKESSLQLRLGGGAQEPVENSNERSYGPDALHFLPRDFLELYGYTREQNPMVLSPGTMTSMTTPMTADSSQMDPQQQQQYFLFNQTPLIYSEPALNIASSASSAAICGADVANGGGQQQLANCLAFSEVALPQVFSNLIYTSINQPLLFNNNIKAEGCGGVGEGGGGGFSKAHQNGADLLSNELHVHTTGAPTAASTTTAASTAAGGLALGNTPVSRMLSRGFTPRSSCMFQTESQPSVATGLDSIYIPNKNQSFSVAEIRDQHIQIQKKYRPSRKRHFTDPVDFEGILNIIGGCSWWQIWVYLLISLQQIPHAMFNLSVVYMMYQPDHWCDIPGMNTTGKPFQWTVEQTLNTTILYPKTRNTQREDPNFHSQCHYYDRGVPRFSQLGRMNLTDAQYSVDREKEYVAPRIEKCTQWHYADDVMKKTIVTEWNLVCDDNFKRAHAHLFYSFGFLLGCLLGGYSSDRFGRKPTVIGFGILSSMFGLILPYSTYFPMFLFIRFCGAVCNEAADLAAYVLCMEITGTRYRAMVGSLLQAPWAVGYALLALIAYFSKSWQSIQLITAALHTVSICLICVLPESPRWLIVNNRVDEAEHYIRRACREPPFPFNLFSFNSSKLPCDLELVKHAEHRQWVRRNQRANIFHLLKSRALCMRTGVICIVWIATALVYYGLVIALSDHSAPGRVLFSGNFFVNNAIAGAIELPTLFCCVYLMRFGRKRSQMFTLVMAAIFIFAAMAAMSARSQMFALGMMLIGKIFIQASFNILYIFTSELYPTVIRNSAVGFCSMIARFGSGVSSYIAILSDVTLAIVPMTIFAIFSLFAGLLVFLLPETRDQPLPDTLQDAVTFLRDTGRAYECVGGFVSQRLFGGRLLNSVSAMRMGGGAAGVGDEGKEQCSGNWTSAGGSCCHCNGGAAAGDCCCACRSDGGDDEQKTLVDVDVDDGTASIVSSVAAGEHRLLVPQQQVPTQKDRLKPALDAIEQTILPSIPEVPEIHHHQHQLQPQMRDKPPSVCGAVSTIAAPPIVAASASKKDFQMMIVDLGPTGGGGKLTNADSSFSSDAQQLPPQQHHESADDIGFTSRDGSTPARQRHIAGDATTNGHSSVTSGNVDARKISINTMDSLWLVAFNPDDDQNYGYRDDDDIIQQFNIARQQKQQPVQSFGMFNDDCAAHDAEPSTVALLPLPPDVADYHQQHNSSAANHNSGATAFFPQNFGDAGGCKLQLRKPSAHRRCNSDT